MQQTISTTEPTGPDAPASEPAQGQRPEHIPEKFWDAEKGVVRVDDLAKSYAELEKARVTGQPAEPKAEEAPEGTPPADQEEATEALRVAGLDMTEFSTEYEKDGQLSEASYAKLEMAGFPRALVDTYVKGLQADAANQTIATAEVQQVKALVGGEEGYAKLATWAQANLTTTELATFNSMVDAGKDQATFAVQALHQRMIAAEGTNPRLTGGKPAGEPSDLFESMAQLVAAQKDPRYRSDPAYNSAVMAKARRSMAAGKI